MLFKKEKKLPGSTDEVVATESQKDMILREASKYFVKYFEAIVAAIVLLIFVIGFLLILNPKYKKINEMEQYTLGDLTTGKTKIELYLEKLIEYRDSFKNVSDISKERIDKAIPQDEHVENLYAQIEALTKRQGVAIRSLAIVSDQTEESNKTEKKGEKAQKDSKESKDKLQVGRANINMTISGVDYAGLKRLLVAFENNLRLLDVYSVNFKPEQKEVELAVYSYYLH